VLEICRALAALARERAEDTAFAEPGRSISYAMLHARARALSLRADTLAGTVAILAPNGIDWVIAWLGLAMASKTIVPLPAFFSPEQLRHTLADSAAGHVLCTDANVALAATLGVPSSLIAPLSEVPGDASESIETEGSLDSRLVIYTSGSTGRPKGVRLGGRQVHFIAASLQQAIAASAADHYLSVLPLSLLLEQICAIAVPILSGARVTLAPAVASQLMTGDAAALGDAFIDAAPTVSVLVPEFLAAWTNELARRKTQAPVSLRYVAVGGAPVAQTLADRAWRLGIPAYEGYGLSECCSVVAVNRPGARVPGAAGKPILGQRVSIEDGEIFVSGPGVMDGYVHGPNVHACWKTGDLGAFDGDGNLIVLGRKDTLLVLANGRNVSPEWIAAMLEADPRIAACKITGHGESRTRAVLRPSPAGAAWFAAAAEDDINALIGELCAAAPEYARPASHEIVDTPAPAPNG